MKNKKYVIILSMILIIAVALMILQVTNFGSQSYWFFTMGLLGIWLASRYLLKKQMSD
jgi:hypothetical protein